MHVGSESPLKSLLAVAGTVARVGGDRARSSADVQQVSREARC
jgi:hypothetical protein